MSEQKDYYSTIEAAKLLGISVRTAQLWVERQVLAAWKTSGGHRRISRESVDRLLLRNQSNLDPASLDRRFKILVVEDNRVLLRLYEANLSGWPMMPRVISANNGLEAMVLIGKEQPDLVITDLNMPEMDGLTMLRCLKEMPELDGIEIVVVTALDKADIDARGGMPQGIPVLPKPIPFDQLREIALKVRARWQSS